MSLSILGTKLHQLSPTCPPYVLTDKLWYRATKINKLNLSTKKFID